MNFVSFDLIKWQALSAGLSGRADWQAWVDSGRLWGEGKLLADKIPPMRRRRMSFLSQLSVQCALMLTCDDELDYVIFSSRHGELTRTASLLKDILNGADASPTAFSQSVHNTAASHYTITSKKPIPATSIGCGENSLGASLIEAAAYLALHPADKVLLVDFDEPVPEPYDQMLSNSHPGYALGLMLTGGDSVELELADNEPSALNLIEHLLHCTEAG